MERLSRGIALEEITAVTKITQRHLVALEQERFGLLPGGILSKGIVRGYAGAIGLDQQDWTERYLKASVAAGQLTDDCSWTDLASNVGQARIQRRNDIEMRLRWAGAILLLLAVAATAYFTVHRFGLRAGWWKTMLPAMKTSTIAHAALFSSQSLIARLLSRFR